MVSLEFGRVSKSIVQNEGSQPTEPDPDLDPVSPNLEVTTNAVDTVNPVSLQTVSTWIS